MAVSVSRRLAGGEARAVVWMKWTPEYDGHRWWGGPRGLDWGRGEVRLVKEKRQVNHNLRSRKLSRPKVVVVIAVLVVLIAGVAGVLGAGAEDELEPVMWLPLIMSAGEGTPAAAPTVRPTPTAVPTIRPTPTREL